MTVVNEEKREIVEVDSLLYNAVAMADALEYYLIEGNIFRTVMVRRPRGLERLTMSTGELLTSVNVLQAKQGLLSVEQKAQFASMMANIMRTRAQLPLLFQEMLVREIMSRLDSINWFLHDCENNKAGCRTNFPSEIRNRQRIEEMIKALGSEISEDVMARVNRIDQRIRRITQQANFIWSQHVEVIYPQEPYWYLYLLPR